MRVFEILKLKFLYILYTIIFTSYASLQISVVFTDTLSFCLLFIMLIIVPFVWWKKRLF